MALPKNYPEHGWQQRLFDAAEIIRDHETDHIEELGEIRVTGAKAYFRVKLSGSEYSVTVVECKTQDRD